MMVLVPYKVQYIYIIHIFTIMMALVPYKVQYIYIYSQSHLSWWKTLLF